MGIECFGEKFISGVSRIKHPRVLALRLMASALVVAGLWAVNDFYEGGTTSASNNSSRAFTYRAFLPLMVNEVSADMPVKVPPSPEPSKVRTPTTVFNPVYEVASCGEITSPGNYLLIQNITGENSCIVIHDTKNVHLDCQGYSISHIVNRDSYRRLRGGLYIENVNDFSIRNCLIRSKIGQRVVRILNSQNGVFQGNTVTGSEMFVETSNNLQITDNKLTTMYSQYKSSFSQILRNQILLNPANYNAYGILSGDGRDNVISDNFVDGASDAFVWDKGADDAIFVSNEQNDVISGNTLSNVYDCGIETSRVIKNSVIEKNRITKAGLCGIGAWHGSSWSNVVVDSNYVSDSSYILYFFLNDFLPEDERVFYFKDNIFSNNKFYNKWNSSYIGPSYPYSVYIDYQNLPNGVFPYMLQIGNNIFRNNDFDSTIVSPFLVPVNMVIDQGGNRCLQYNNPSYPLHCVD